MRRATAVTTAQRSEVPRYTLRNLFRLDSIGVACCSVSVLGRSDRTRSEISDGDGPDQTFPVGVDFAIGLKECASKLVRVPRFVEH